MKRSFAEVTPPDEGPFLPLLSHINFAELPTEVFDIEVSGDIDLDRIRAFKRQRLSDTDDDLFPVNEILKEVESRQHFAEHQIREIEMVRKHPHLSLPFLISFH